MTNKTRGAIGAAAFACALALGLAPAGAQSKGEMYDRCTVGGGAEAIAACTWVLTHGGLKGGELKGGDRASFYDVRGQNYRRLKQYQKAIADYSEAIRLLETSPPRKDYGPEHVYVNRGNTYLELKQYQRAIADYDRAIRRKPRFSLAYKNRAAARYQLRDYRAAIDDLGRAIQIDPREPFAYGMRAHAYVQSGQYQKAIADCDRAIRIRPRYPAAYRARAKAWEGLGQRPKAIADYRQAVRLWARDQESLAALKRLGAKP